ncbi:uncharacterized protein Triagg1_2180 [Trichoderma aggressivum f. europaeum]|uniref:Uncharacterized protein n=1 Tax=Trichoderma aggressivum f. europaeum TaxID=173218 RepID=A0AAE1M8E8_9HYPO|nr:hypothetical protein Triagg1_2180 [Trichoderma aggressivum f. europaeum]
MNSYDEISSSQKWRQYSHHHKQNQRNHALITANHHLRSSLTWRGSAVLSFDADYETPTPSPDEYSSPDPYSFEDTWYSPPSTIEPTTTPRPQYSAIVTIRTTTWVLSRSTTITSVILETYYSTLTDVEDSNEGGTVTMTESDPSGSAPCAAASGNPSGYGYECSSSTRSSVRAMTTITWSPEVTAYPPPSVSDQARASPASTSTTSSSSASSSTTATATATDEGTETPPVVTGAAPPPLGKADTRAMGAVVALLAILA